MGVKFGFLVQELEELEKFRNEFDSLIDENFVFSYFMYEYDDNYCERYNKSKDIEIVLTDDFYDKLDTLYFSFKKYYSDNIPPTVINILVDGENCDKTLILDIEINISNDKFFNGNINEFASYVLDNTNMYYSTDNNMLQLYEIYKYSDEVSKYFYKNIDEATLKFISNKFTVSMPCTLDLQRLIIILIADFGSSVLIKFDKLFYEVIPLINQKYEIKEKNVYIEAFKENLDDEDENLVSIEEISEAALTYIRKKLEPRFSTADIDSNVISNLYEIYVNKK